MPARCKELSSGADSSHGESAMSHRPRPHAARRLAQPRPRHEAPRRSRPAGEPARRLRCGSSSPLAAGVCPPGHGAVTGDVGSAPGWVSPWFYPWVSPLGLPPGSPPALGSWLGGFGVPVPRGKLHQ